MPIVMASGDNFLEQEIKSTLGENVAVAVVKTALSFVRPPSPPISLNLFSSPIRRFLATM